MTGQLTNLDHEADKREGVIVEHDSTNVANTLRDTTHEHTGHEPPTLPSESEIEMDDSDETEEGKEEDVGRKRRTVGVETPLDGTVVEVAGRVVTKGIGLLRGRKICVCGRHVGDVFLVLRGE